MAVWDATYLASIRTKVSNDVVTAKYKVGEAYTAATISSKTIANGHVLINITFEVTDVTIAGVYLYDGNNI